MNKIVCLCFLLSYLSLHSVEQCKDPEFKKKCIQHCDNLAQEESVDEMIAQVRCDDDEDGEIDVQCVCSDGLNYSKKFELDDDTFEEVRD